MTFAQSEWSVFLGNDFRAINPPIVVSIIQVKISSKSLGLFDTSGKSSHKEPMHTEGTTVKR